MRTFVDLFAGCGGLSLGLEQARFKPICFSEISTEAVLTYKHNRPHIPWDERNYYPDTWSLVKGAIKSRPIKKLVRNLGLDNGELDLVCGGPPCQGFSRIGHRRLHATDRENIPSNYLYEAMAQVIKTTTPKLFLFENVQGLLTAKWQDRSSGDGVKGAAGEVFSDVLETFDKLRRYVIRFRLVRAYEYGVPQNRPRVLLVGIRDDIFESLLAHKKLDPADGPLSRTLRRTKFPPNPLTAFRGKIGDGFFPDPSEQDSWPSIEEALSDLVDHRSYEQILLDASKQLAQLATDKYLFEPSNEFQLEMRKAPPLEIIKKLNGQWIADEIKNHEYSRHSEKTRDRFQRIQQLGKAEGDLKNKKFSQRRLPRTWEDVPPNITVCSMPDDYVHYQEGQNRSLTVREWARLQTFPDWYEFHGKRTTGGIRRAGRPQEGIFEREVPQYTQIGNAVPVRLARHIGNHFSKLLKVAGKTKAVLQV